MNMGLIQGPMKLILPFVLAFLFLTHPPFLHLLLSSIVITVSILSSPLASTSFFLSFSSLPSLFLCPAAAYLVLCFRICSRMISRTWVRAWSLLGLLSRHVPEVGVPDVGKRLSLLWLVYRSLTLWLPLRLTITGRVGCRLRLRLVIGVFVVEEGVILFWLFLRRRFDLRFIYRLIITGRTWALICCGLVIRVVFVRLFWILSLLFLRRTFR